ncbi:MAG TPA: nucleotidyltransferase family protein [Rhodocyclaceae bacterium]|nr:nucleotidyltransferase family protein [Rhodocyclaceae bacterium]
MRARAGMGMEAIVLAVGLGTRLSGVVPDLPKPLAPVAGRPFLSFVLDALDAGGFDTVVLAVGHRAQAIRDCYGERYGTMRLAYSVESTPLGTGGAIALALRQTSGAEVFVLNGDTFVELDFGAMRALHAREAERLTMAAQAVDDAGRYGTLDVRGDHVHAFVEKGRSGPGLINAGVYLLRRDLLGADAVPDAFSFETDFLMPRAAAIRPRAFRTRGLFIDIGVPEDYARAQAMLAALGSGPVASS